MKRNNDQVSLSQKSELSKLESKSFHGTHPPARLGEVLLQLLGDRGVDVPLALLARDPAVLEGIATKKKKTLTTNICISCCSHICFLLEGIYYEEEKTFATNTCICCFQFMYLFFAQGHSYQAKNFNLQYLYLYFLSMYLYFAQGHSYDGGKHQH